MKLRFTRTKCQRACVCVQTFTRQGRTSVCVRQHIRTPVVLGITFLDPVFSPAAFHGHWSTFFFYLRNRARLVPTLQMSWPPC